MRSVILLSLTASLNPTLLAVSTVMMLLDQPKRLMLNYLLGAYVVSITLGLVIAFSLSDSGAVTTTQHTLSPAVDIALGALALAVAFVLATGRHERISQRRRTRREAKPKDGPPRWQRKLSEGSPRTAFVIGMVLTLPGASYLAGLHAISQLDSSTVVTVLLVVGFNVVMLWLLEVPLVCYIVAPRWTPGAIDRAKGRIARHARKVAVGGFAGVGAALVLKGVIGLIS